MQPSTPSRPVRNCQHPGRIHRHGTRVAYVKDRCRCPACTAANTAATRTRRRRTVFGYRDESTLVNVGPTRQQIARLRDAGIGYARLANLTGTSTRHLRDLTRTTSNTAGKGPIRRIRAGLADALLAIDPGTTPHLRAAIGTRRRVTALIALGWPLPYIAARLGRRTDSLARTLAAQRVTAGTAAAAALLYDELSGDPPVGGHGKLTTGGHETDR